MRTATLTAQTATIDLPFELRGKSVAEHNTRVEILGEIPKDEEARVTVRQRGKEFPILKKYLKLH